MLKRNEAFQEATWAEALQEAATSLKSVLQEYGSQGVAILVSPQMTNEELFFVRKLFRDHFKIENIASQIPYKEPGYSDDFLIMEDKNPNTRGVELLVPNGSNSEALLQSCMEGRIQFLYVFQHDLTSGFDPSFVAEAFKKVSCVVFQGSWDQPTAALADIQLPAAVYAEKEGTFTNFQGRAQRIQAAVPPIGKSLTDLDILAKLASSLDVAIPVLSAEQIFEEIGRSVDAFSGMNWQSLGTSGQLTDKSGN